jgi:cytochrome c oxidase subunit III
MLSPEEEIIAKQKAKKNLLWVGLISIIMLFAGLTSAYIVRMAEGNWEYIDLPLKFYFSTAVIILSSISMNMAMGAAKNNDKSKIKSGVLLTLLLGLIFMVLQALGWRELVEQGFHFTGSGASGSYFYVLSGVHFAHVAGGIIALVYVFSQSLKGAYSADNKLGLELCSTYWHFLDFLWIYLFLFLLFIR